MFWNLKCREVLGEVHSQLLISISLLIKLGEVYILRFGSIFADLFRDGLGLFRGRPEPFKVVRNCPGLFGTYSRSSEAVRDCLELSGTVWSWFGVIRGYSELVRSDLEEAHGTTIVPIHYGMDGWRGFE